MKIKLLTGPATLIVVFAAYALAPGGALAGTLDQQQTHISGAPSTIHSEQILAQTFTAGIGGGLDQVDLYLDKAGAPAAPLSVEIRDVTGGLPGSAVLASFSVQADDVAGVPGGWEEIKFGAPAPVAAGTQYAIVAYSSATFQNDYGWYGDFADNSYAAGGSLFTPEFPPLGSWTSTISDQAFKTYVVPNVVPAPGPTGQRAAALKRCKKKDSKKARKKCKKRAKRLPV